MGLRINTNISSIRALRTLRSNDRSQARSLERLSTGLRINRGSDDPSGLVISEQLRSQVHALEQAVTNSQNAGNLISIADAALGEVSTLLVQIQDSIVFAQSTGGATPAQIAAEQDAVDQAVSAIDRIAATTRFADRPLLNGNAEFQVADSLDDFFDDVEIRSANFAGTDFEQDLEITEVTNAQRAELRFQSVSATGAGGTTLRITGSRGTSDVVLAAGANANDMEEAINGVAGFTGVYASGTTDNTGGAGSPQSQLLLRSEGFGSAEFIKMEVVSGSLVASGGAASMTAETLSASSPGVGAYAADTNALSGGAMGVGQSISDAGLDGQVSHQGQIFTGIGNHFEIVTNRAQFSFNIDPDLITATNGASGAGPAGFASSPNDGSDTTANTFTITIANTGLNFQLNEQPLPTDKFAVGIRGISASTLGYDAVTDRIEHAVSDFATAGNGPERGGYLSTLKTGAGNDLTQNPENALGIVQAAVTDVASLRGYLGAVQADTIDPNITSLGVAIENLSAS
ncbi:MAG: flagellin, partial [Planctomycetota bacterium]|nr:flagellin [Planctomycetota bacterium]